MSDTDLQRTSLYPVLPLRDIVVFPHMIVPLFVGREKSVRALEDVMKDDKQVLLATQKNAAQDDPQADDIYTVGTVGTVLQLLKLPDGTVKVLIEGGQRARIVKFAENENFFQGFVETIADLDHEGKEVEALARSVVAHGRREIDVPRRFGLREAGSTAARSRRRSVPDAGRTPERSDDRQPVHRARYG